MDLDLEIVGVAATVRYGGLKHENPPVVYVPYAQLPPSATAADDLRLAHRRRPAALRRRRPPDRARGRRASAA